MDELVLGICLLVAVVALVKPYIGLLGYVVMLYLRPGDMFPILEDYSLMRIVAIALLISVFVLRSEGEVLHEIPAAMKYFFWFLGAVVLSGLSGYIPSILAGVTDTLKNLALFALVVALVNTSQRLKGLLWCIVVCGSILALPNILTYAAFEGDRAMTAHLAGLAVGYMSGSGDYALSTNMILGQAGGLLLAGRNFLSRGGALVGGLLLIGGIVTSHARGGGVIAMGAVLLSLLVMAWRGGGALTRLAALAVVVALAAGIVVSAPAAFKARAATIANYSGETTALRRIEYWKLGVKMFLSSPIWGVGAYGYASNYRRFGGWENLWRVSHNTFVTLFAELGLVGAYCFAMMFAPTVRNLWRLGAPRGRDPDEQIGHWMASGALVSLIAFFTGGMFQTVLYYPLPYLHLGIGIAVLRIWSAAEDEEDTPGEPAVVEDGVSGSIREAPGVPPAVQPLLAR